MVGYHAGASPPKDPDSVERCAFRRTTDQRLRHVPVAVPNAALVSGRQSHVEPAERCPQRDHLHGSGNQGAVNTHRLNSRRHRRHRGARDAIIPHLRSSGRSRLRLGKSAERIGWAYLNPCRRSSTGASAPRRVPRTHRPSRSARLGSGTGHARRPGRHSGSAGPGAAAQGRSPSGSSGPAGVRRPRRNGPPSG